MTEKIINILIERGYAKTKSEALRYALLHVGQEMQIVQETSVKMMSMAGALRGKISIKDIVREDDHEI